MADDDDGDMTMNELETQAFLSLEGYFALDGDIQRESEVVEGHLVSREPRNRPHQRTGFRLAQAFEVAVAKYRSSHDEEKAPCIDINTEVPVRLWEVPLTLRIPDVVVHHCREVFETLGAGDILIAVEAISRWSQSRDRIHKMGEYAKSGIPHYLIVQVDEIGALIVEHYALTTTDRRYSRISVNHRDGDIWALNISHPFDMQIGWQDLEIAPRT
ncbi:Uma2 family endonuclease [Actinomadura sp. 7K507]|uniref:Uma2 family endonuclease n=1 Tax=Actinomadura sp. 7K507 TaxID=2530365 RepID=UPI0010538B77|nr:Uma2 family endonuclease [Actinomadura sp. 7K507]TDC77183.1 Uma2 family endonuclease [Actinomadura sp. 7K507]